MQNLSLKYKMHFILYFAFQLLWKCILCLYVKYICKEYFLFKHIFLYFTQRRIYFANDMHSTVLSESYLYQ